jgi:hypothetical protein
LRELFRIVTLADSAVGGYRILAETQPQIEAGEKYRSRTISSAEKGLPPNEHHDLCNLRRFHCTRSKPGLTARLCRSVLRAKKHASETRLPLTKLRVHRKLTYTFDYLPLLDEA